MKTYLDLLRRVLDEGTHKEDRTGTGTLSLFGAQMRFNLREGFPAVTTKKLQWKSMAHELIWFLKGETNIGYLKEHKVGIWDAWADENGDLGPVYGAQWRAWPTPTGDSVDQIAQLIEQLKSNPESRRHIVSAWNVGQIPNMNLPPCHLLFQFYVANNRLSCQLYQRSADLFLGVPFNIASYSLLTHMLAQVCDFEVGDFVHTIGDAHIYLNHVEQVKTQLERPILSSPTLWLDPSIKEIDDFRYEHMRLENYEHAPAIRAPVAV